MTQNEKVSYQETDFLGRLRQSTAAMHKKLESTALSLALTRDETTLGDYCRYLQCMKDIVAFYDHHILPQLPAYFPDVMQRRKSQALLRDLEELGAQISPNTMVPFKAPFVNNEAEAVGMAYVIEGSTLGGRILLKHVEALHISPNHGGHFFAGYGENTSAMWKAFLNSMTNYVQAENAADLVIGGAAKGFEMVFNHFENQSTQ